MADPRTLARLDRLARIRAVDRTRAAETLAQTSAQHGRLSILSERSRALAAAYGRDTSPGDGQALARLMGFRAELVAIAEQTASDAATAETRALAARQALVVAERRQEQVAERLAAERQTLAAASQAADNDLARNLKKRG